MTYLFPLASSLTSTAKSLALVPHWRVHDSLPAPSYLRTKASWPPALAWPGNAPVVYPNAYNEHLVWGSILVLILTRGPGVVSLDYLIARLMSRQPPAHVALTREA